MTDTDTGRILVVLFECAGARAIVSEVVSRARGIRPVTVLQVLDPAYADRLCRKLRNDGWMGSTRSKEIGKQALDEYVSRFDESIAVVCGDLRDAGLDVTHECRSGELINTTLRLAEQSGDLSLLLVGQPHRGFLARWLDALTVRVLIDRAPCPVELIDLPND